MRPDPTSTTPASPYCENPNMFTDIYENTIEPRLPREGSIADTVLEHTTGIRSFFETTSGELCENGRVSQESAESTLRCIARSAATGAVVVGTASLVAVGAVVGSPVAAVGLGVAGLAFLPPLAERAAFGAASFLGDVLSRFKRSDDSF